MNWARVAAARQDARTWKKVCKSAFTFHDFEISTGTLSSAMAHYHIHVVIDLEETYKLNHGAADGCEVHSSNTSSRSRLR